MDDWFVVISLSLAMLVGCYLAGCIPLAFTFSEDKLKLLTIFGAGLLVGTALAIIVPEGINAIYSNDHTHSSHASIQHKPLEVAVPQQESNLVRKLQEAVEEAALPAVVKPPVSVASDVKSHDHHHEESHDHSHAVEHKCIGVSLVAGFVFMLIVDQIGGAHSHGTGSTDAESLTSETHHARNKVTATLGLCVHAAADGVALGAATSVSQTGLTIVVFVAIMLHKAPAAFGLVSFLLHDGLDRGRIRKHLLLFSAAAPIGAILTFFILNHQNKEALAYYNATGIAMLFSAGTFLYVATVHILPEVSSKSSRTISSDGTVVIREHKGFSKLELLAIIVGSLLPVGISLGHGHSH